MRKDPACATSTAQRALDTVDRDRAVWHLLSALRTESGPRSDHGSFSGLSPRTLSSTSIPSAACTQDPIFPRGAYMDHVARKSALIDGPTPDTNPALQPSPCLRRRPQRHALTLPPSGHPMRCDEHEPASAITLLLQTPSPPPAAALLSCCSTSDVDAEDAPHSPGRARRVGWPGQGPAFFWWSTKSLLLCSLASDSISDAEIGTPWMRECTAPKSLWMAASSARPRASQWRSCASPGMGSRP